MWNAAIGVATRGYSEEADLPHAPEIWQKRGESLLLLIYGSFPVSHVHLCLLGRQYNAVREKLRAYHPDLETLVIEFAYGRVLSRPYLSYVMRQISM